MAVSQQTIDTIKGYLEDYETHAGECIYIRDHNTSAIVPLKFNASQKICNNIAEQQLKEFGFVRVIDPLA